MLRQSSNLRRLVIEKRKLIESIIRFKGADGLKDLRYCDQCKLLAL